MNEPRRRFATKFAGNSVANTSGVRGIVRSHGFERNTVSQSGTFPYFDASEVTA